MGRQLVVHDRIFSGIRLAPPITAPARIAFYTDSASIGGAELILGRLMSELDPNIEAVATGIDHGVVDWLASQRPGTTGKVMPPVFGKRDAAEFAGNVRSVAGLRADIFHANLSGPAACQYALAAASLVPRVRTVAVEHLPYPLTGRLQLLLKQITSRRLSAHVAVGHEVARQIERYAHLRPGSVRAIHNGVADLDLVPLPRPFTGPTVGTIGRLDRQKGIDVLLHSLAEIPGAGLVVVGDGPERASLERLARELGISDRVCFQGWQKDARRHLTTFDVFALASRFEGFPLVIVEAMLAGLPVVATSVGSVSEAVLDHHTGLLVGSGDVAALTAALGSLLSDPELRLRMGAEGRERARAFNPAAMARAFEDLYRELLA
jgi:glycosyltransferase involved in cell wall biosynthesis